MALVSCMHGGLVLADGLTAHRGKRQPTNRTAWVDYISRISQCRSVMRDSIMIDYLKS